MSEMRQGLALVFLALLVVSVVSVAIADEARVYIFDVVLGSERLHVVATTADECRYCNGTIRVRAGTNVDDTYKAQITGRIGTDSHSKTVRDLIAIPDASDPPRIMLLDEMAGDIPVSEYEHDHGMD